MAASVWGYICIALGMYLTIEADKPVKVLKTFMLAGALLLFYGFYTVGAVPWIMIRGN
jgi:hypothetical protein